MRHLILISLLLLTKLSSAQLIKGRLLEDERKMITPYSFTTQDANTGVLLYELAVSPQGNVSSARLISEGSTVTSTPTRVKVKNELMKLKFQEGMFYPEFHHVTVKVTALKTAP